jgi:superfamily II DNA/RNA helicase
MIERLACDILKDKYFISLNNKAAKLMAGALFLEPIEKTDFSDKEFRDIMRCADILSNSKTPIARNKAYQIITLLNSTYESNPLYRTFSHAVLAKLGNFPGIEFLKESNNNHSQLPLDRDWEKKIKEFVQAVPESDKLIFTDSQYELYTKISNAKQFSFSGPTSMGKSFIIKSFIRKVISNKPPENIVVMVPTRALINQFSIDFNRELKDSLDHYGFKVVTNSNVPDLPPDAKQNYLFVLTPERFLSYLSQSNNPKISYLFIDEAHKLAAEKDARSITAYSAISRALRQNPNLNLYFSSPNVSNPEVFLKLFKKDQTFQYKTIEAPVAQNLFFIDLLEKKATHYLDDEAYDFEPQLLKKITNLYELIIKTGGTESNIIYCSSKLDSVEKSRLLFEERKNEEIPQSKNIQKAIRQIRGYIHKDYYLCDFLTKGIGYHFGTLPQIIRNKVETLFKEKEINYVFCTSTLLEGVNLPAKNVFILNNRNGGKPFQPIDFWNLAGRAGRLKLELSGNIICVREKEGDWKKHNDLLANKKAEINLNPTVENYIDRKLKKIEEILKGNPEIINETKEIQEILRYIANIISIDTLEIKRANYESEIIKKLILDNKDTIIELAKKKTEKIEVPSSVLNTNQSIKLDIQNEAFIELKKLHEKKQNIKLPNQVTYENCFLHLQQLYHLFKWSTEEEELKNVNRLVYYGFLMNKWINGTPLNRMISESIDYYRDKNIQIMTGYNNGKQNYEFFDGSKRHVNVLIGQLIENIEYTLRYLFEKYFNTYYAMVVAILGEGNGGSNWSTFLEYGTQNSIIIALQNFGLSRHSADYIYKNHRSCLKIENEKLIEINTKKLRELMPKDSVEYDEVSSLLF